jgi:N utilization substance protein B
MGSPGPRRQAREAALQVLYAADLVGQLDPDGVRRTFEEIVEEFSLPPRAQARARALSLGVAENLKCIDERIGSASSHWKLHRIASVERNVLRIGAYELIFEPETPTGVILDEALEVARRYAGEGSRAFVNGVLDMIARGRPEGQA